MPAIQKRQDVELVELKQQETALREAEYERNLVARLEEIAAAGIDKLNGSTNKANAWIRHYFRIRVANNRVVRINY